MKGHKYSSFLMYFEKKKKFYNLVFFSSDGFYIHTCSIGFLKQCQVYVHSDEDHDILDD
jgi:hypothetical protein